MRFAASVMWIGVAFVVAILVIVLITMAWPRGASAHDAPSGFKYDKQCCGDHDCHPTPCENISSTDGGFTYSDPVTRATYFFTRDKMKMSLDGECHVCLHKVNNWDTNHNQSINVSPICVYLPVRM